MPAGMGVNILTPSGKLLKLGQSKSKVFQNPVFLFAKFLECIEDPGNDQLAAFRGDLKRLTSMTSIPNNALKTIDFLYAFRWIIEISQ